LIKFSCPECITGDLPNLSAERLQERLREHFSSRIQRIDKNISLKIVVSTEKPDRVAL